MSSYFMAQRTSRLEPDLGGEVGYGKSLKAVGTPQAQCSDSEMLATHNKAEELDSQPFWLGRHRVYAEFSSPEDEEDAHESGCCKKNSTIKILIFDHATRMLKISTGLDEVNDKKHIILRLPDRSTKPIHVYKESITTDAAKCAPVFRAFRTIGGNEPDNMSYADTVCLNKLSWAGRFKIKTGQIRWLFFINLDQSLSGFSGKSQLSSSGAS